MSDSGGDWKDGGERVTMFDAYIAVDWSARSQPSPMRPSKDAIWTGEFVTGSRSADTRYFRTRSACAVHVRRRLLDHRAASRRVFVGFDFAYGYPRGFAHALGHTGPNPAWRFIWDELGRLIRDDPSNANNRFAVAASLNHRCSASTPGPFWGCPTAAVTPTLTSTMKSLFRYPYPSALGRELAVFRQTERALSGVQSTWKLAGAGSVGSQALLGIPVVRTLRDDPELSGVSRVWPFETGFTSKPTPERGPFVLHVEIWPSVVNNRIEPAFAIRDEVQVHAFVTWLAEMDQTGELAPLFAFAGGAVDERICVEEEGWIFGARHRPK